MQHDPADFLRALIRCPSVTPAEGGALAWLEALLKRHGFAVDRMTFTAPGTPDVENLFAMIGSGAPHVVFAGHTDVVPPGDAAGWRHPPFSAEIEDGVMYGRGAVDMKGGIAAFLAAAFRYLDQAGPAPGTISLLITGDEEGPAINGTEKVLAWAAARGHRFDAAIVGEPTSVKRVGDTIKNGRRGSLSAAITVRGRQGHVAYPQLADNPVPRLIRMLAALVDAPLDTGNAHFQPSNLEVVSVDVGNPAYNVIPAEARAKLNIRFNDNWTAESITAWLREKLDGATAGHPYELTLQRASVCFVTKPGPLVDTLADAVHAVTGAVPELSTGGGTSDARYFKDTCPVVELGLLSETLHQTDERVALADLERLAAIYQAFLERFFARGAARAEL
jgi:succinyl-diaminopimelate desuccinylase